MHWSSAPRTKWFVAVVAAVPSLGPMAIVAAAASSAPPYRAPVLRSGPRAGATYVALGDSYASGEGLAPYERGTAVRTGRNADTCHRSRRHAYADLSPAIVMPRVKNRAFWACSGATTAQMNPRSSAAFVPQHGEPIQVRTVGRTTRFISVQVGGDDVGFSRIVRACIEAVTHSASTSRGAGTTSVYRASSISCANELRAARAKATSLVAHLRVLYAALLARASPSAELVVVGYPRVFPKRLANLPRVRGVATCVLDTYPIPDGSIDVALTAADANGVQRLIVVLDNKIKRAIATLPRPERSRVAYADTYDASVPHSCRGQTPTATVRGLVLGAGAGGVTGLLGGSVSTASFHPSAAGQIVFAHSVERSFLRLRAATKAAKP